MSNFRKYGGINFSQNANIVKHNMLNSKNVSYLKSGLYNSRETFLSHIDMSGNSILHIGNLYFQDGTSISSGTMNLGISQVLGYDPDASGKSMINVGNVGYSNGKTQSSSYTGHHPFEETTYNYATITLDTNGKISGIVDNPSIVSGLGDVLDVSGDGNGNSITNISNISANDFVSTNILNLTSDGKIKFTNDKEQTSSYTGWIPPADNTSYNLPTLTFDTNGKIIGIVENNSSPYGLEDILNNSNDGGGLGIENIKNIVQTGTGTNILKSTEFQGNISQVGTVTNILKSTEFQGNISQVGTVTNILKSTEFQGNVTQSSNGEIILQSGTGTNILKSTEFQGISKYSSSYIFSDINDIPNKGYVDNLASGISPTALCKCATTGNIDLLLIPEPLTVDNYVVLNGDRILVKSQGDNSGNNINTTNVDNGIYIYNVGSPSTLTRSGDCSNGDDVSNQLTFITDGSLNKMKSFVQTVSGAEVGTNSLNYVPFYSLNYNLGQGLELVSGATLQVKPLLDFLKGISIEGILYLEDINNNPGYKTQIYHEDESVSFVNNTDTSNISFLPSYIFSCNNLGDDSKETIPLSFNSSSFTIDVSNNISSSSSVVYRAINNSTYGYPIGHNFTGDCHFNGNQIFNSVDLNSNTSLNSKIFQGNKTFYIDNNSNTIDYYDSSVIFACNNLGGDDKQTIPLKFNSSSFTIDVSNNISSSSPVVYRAINNSIYGYPIGHNFTGNCYFNNSISFENKTVPTYNIPNTLGWLLNVGEINRGTFDSNINTQASLITNQLLYEASYLMNGFIKFQYNGTKGDIELLTYINLNIYYDDPPTEPPSSIISLGDISFMKNKIYTYPFSLIVSGINSMYFSITHTSGSNVGNWTYIALSNVVFSRMS